MLSGLSVRYHTVTVSTESGRSPKLPSISICDLLDDRRVVGKRSVYLALLDKLDLLHADEAGLVHALDVRLPRHRLGAREEGPGHVDDLEGAVRRSVGEGAVELGAAREDRVGDPERSSAVSHDG